MTVAADAAVDRTAAPAADLRVDVPRVRPRAHRAFDVAVVGLGYVGLPTALAFHAGGSHVVGLDISTTRLGDIRSESVDVVASDAARLRGALNSTAFEISDDLDLLSGAAGVLVCVPTPIDEHLTPDLRPLRNACAAVVRRVSPGQVIVLTSTTYAGCTRDLLVEPLAQRGFEVGRDVFVAFSPERIDPGNTIHAHEDVPRVVGGVTPACTERAAALLQRYVREVHRVGSPEAAELTKLLENTFRAVNIALANEVADVCRHLGVSAAEVIDAAATKPFGFMPFYPGPGVGGHCIPCDPHYLLWQLRAERKDAPVISSAMTSIALRPNAVHQRALELLADRGIALRDSRVLVLGITYKADIADVRESPALTIIESLRRAGSHVDFHDPLVATVDLAGDTVIGVSGAGSGAYDLVIVHSLHSRLDPAWLDTAPVVLDTTFRLAHPKAVAL
jgi:UDP-N-acetyl-D-glucosamine dehydrogenase